MEELIRKIQEQVGVSEETAKKTVEVVSRFMEEKLPASLGEQVTGVLSGGLGQVGELADKAGDLARDLSARLRGDSSDA